MKTSRNKSSRRSSKAVLPIDGSERRQDTGLSPSKRHREKLNNVMDELSDLLPLASDAKSGLDRLSILKLTVSFFQTQNLIKSSGKTKQSNGAIKKKVHVQGVSLSEMALEAVGGFFIVLTEDGNVYYVSENVKNYLGYSQTRLMHQEFFSHVHPDDLQGLKSCFEECPSKTQSLSKEDHDLPFTLPGWPIQLKLVSSCFPYIGSLVTDKAFSQGCKIHVKNAIAILNVMQEGYPVISAHFIIRFYGHLKMVKKSEKAGSQYGFFALCSPVSRNENITKPIKEHVEKYTCKMDAAMSNLQVDSRGLKVLRFNEQDLMGKSAYFFFHPEDLNSMALVHERLMKEFKASITFRIMKGNGKWQWVRGTGYSLMKNGQIEGMVANNVFVSDEEGAYYKAQNIKEMKEWKEQQEKALAICQSSTSSSSCSSPCGSGSWSSDADTSYQSLSSNPAGFIASTADDGTLIQTSSVSKSPSHHNGSVLPLAGSDYHEATPTTVGVVTTKNSPTIIHEHSRSPHCNSHVATKSEAVGTPQVSPECLAVIDNEMISIIKELQSSFIDGADDSLQHFLSSSQKSDSFFIERPFMPMPSNSTSVTETSCVNVPTGAPFMTNHYPVANTYAFHPSGGVFDAPHIDEMSLPQDGQHFVAKTMNANPSYLEPGVPKNNGVVEENNVYLKDCDTSADRLHEDSFKDFEMLPLGDIESILSNESHPYSHPLSSNLPILEHVLMDSQSNSMSESYQQKLPATTEVFHTDSALYKSQENPSLDPVTTSDLVSCTFAIANGMESGNRMDLPRKRENGGYIEDIKNCNFADHHSYKNHNTSNSCSEPINGANSMVLKLSPETGKLNHGLSIRPAAAWMDRK